MISAVLGEQSQGGGRMPRARAPVPAPRRRDPVLQAVGDLGRALLHLRLPLPWGRVRSARVPRLPDHGRGAPIPDPGESRTRRSRGHCDIGDSRSPAASGTAVRRECASGFKRVTAPADRAGRRLGRFGHRQHLHELTCFLIGHPIRPYASSRRSSWLGSRPGRGLVNAARATTAARGDEADHDDRRDHHENSDCDPGVSAERHLLSPFVGRVVHR
jgi:hypothetical protein